MIYLIVFCLRKWARSSTFPALTEETIVFYSLDFSTHPNLLGIIGISWQFESQSDIDGVWKDLILKDKEGRRLIAKTERKIGPSSRIGLSTVGGIFLIAVMMIAIIGAAGIGYQTGGFASSQSNDSLQNQVSSIQTHEWNLPLMNQTPSPTRQIIVEWSLLTAGQDRFVPSTKL